MWTVDDAEVTATFQGFTTPLRDLYAAIASRGWEITKVKWGTDGFEAEAKNPTTGAKLKRVAPTEDGAVAHLLLSVTRSDFIHARAARVKLGMWQTTFVDKLTEIAEAYAKAPVYEPKAVGAWMELAHDSERRYEVLQGEMQIEVVDEPDPYTTLEEMCKDVHNKHLYVTRAGAEHPVWSVDQFVAFRAVHDVLGHCASGGDFGWHGENQACAAHFPLLSPNAQQALFTEAIGRSAYQTFFKGHGPRKIALLDDFMEEAQASENSAGHVPVHPSQSLPPTEVPHAPITASFHRNAGYIDPNDGWNSGVEPIVGINGQPWRSIENDPLGIHRPNPQGVSAQDQASNLARIDPSYPDKRWWDLEHPDGSPNREQMRQAIVNAFAATLLAPGKDSHWHATHYQDIADLAHVTEDPDDLHARLEQRRVEHNRAKRISPLAHRPYYREQQDFAQFLKASSPTQMTDGQAQVKAHRETQRLLETEKRRLADEAAVAEAGKPPEKRTPLSLIEVKAGQEVARILRDLVNPAHDPATDFSERPALVTVPQPNMPMFGSATELPVSDDPTEVVSFDGQVNPEAMGAYGSWMHDHLKSIARVNRHSDAILDAARKDLDEREGAGHHFRSYVNSLGLPGVGPQATSFAWHLLAPERSQLATIDGHMLEALGRKPDEHPSPRDYFKLERELRARLDAAGYQDVPLGLAQSALWDYKVHGRDHHQDLAPLRPLSFVPQQRVDWPARAPQGKPSKLPDPWWKETEGIGDQIGQHFDDTVGSKFRADEIPFQDDRRYLPVTAATQSADELHLAWPVPANVRTDIANWVSTVEWPDGVELEDPAKYHITAVYAEGGWNDKATHALIRQQTTTDIPFESTGLELFGPNKDTVVLRLESDEADHWANTLMDQAEEMGIDVSRYPGGYKPHITLATGASDLPEGQEIQLSFRGGKLYVSVPREIAENDQEHHIFAALELPAPAVTHPDGDSDVGAPGETIMQYLRNQLGLTTEQAWEFEGDVRKIGP